MTGLFSLIDAHPAVTAFLLIVLTIVLFYFWWKQAHANVEDHSPTAYSMLSQAVFVVTDILLPMVGFYLLAFLLDAATPEFFKSVLLFFRGVPLDFATIMLVIIIAILLALMQTYQLSITPDNPHPRLSSGQVWVLFALRGFFYFANIPLLTHLDDVSNIRMAIFALDSVVLIQFAYIHYRSMRAKRDHFIHGIVSGNV